MGQTTIRLKQGHIDVYTYIKIGLEITLVNFKHLSYFCISALMLSNCGMTDLLTNKPVESANEKAAININPNNIIEESESIFDLFSNNYSESTLKVNRYIWKASLEVLNFLPLEGADPFSGIITTGWGSPPGTNTLYKATIYIQDPSLDARALKVTLLRKNGLADSETIKAVENAILSRARQLRISDDKL